MPMTLSTLNVLGDPETDIFLWLDEDGDLVGGYDRPSNMEDEPVFILCKAEDLRAFPAQLQELINA